MYLVKMHSFEHKPLEIYANYVFEDQKKLTDFPKLSLEKSSFSFVSQIEVHFEHALPWKEKVTSAERWLKAVCAFNFDMNIYISFKL